MLRSAKGLKGATLCAQDGELGSVEEFLFDDEYWTIRYLVANTGGWLLGRRVLIAPVALGHSAWERNQLHVNLTREQIERSPGVDTHQPVSRHWEAGYYDYFGWPYYWGGVGLWGWGWYPAALLARQTQAMRMDRKEMTRTDSDPGDQHLRSTDAVTGYGICAVDGRLGHVEDFVMDDASWAIRYLSIDTRDWLPGKKVLVPPAWIQEVNWPNSSVTVDLRRDQIRSAPEWNPAEPISREYEARLHAHYGRKGYWHSPDQERYAA